jgi:hypothetical protein
MKRNIMKFFMVFSIVILFGTGLALAGGRNHYSGYPGASRYGVHHYKHHGGYTHHRSRPPARHYYDHGPRYYHYRHYGPPARYRYYNYYYPGDWGRYDDAYHFSGGFSEPGFGFVFGTRGNW